MAIQNVIDRPASECDPHAICMGPTAVDLSPVADADFQASLSARQAKDKLLLARRLEGSRRAYWQKPHAAQFY